MMRKRNYQEFLIINYLNFYQLELVTIVEVMTQNNPFKYLKEKMHLLMDLGYVILFIN
jgi:hypothetical protein